MLRLLRNIPGRTNSLTNARFGRKPVAGPLALHRSLPAGAGGNGRADSQGDGVGEDKKGQEARPRAAARRGTPHRDQWFDSELNRLYDDVLREPLPKDLAELVEKLKIKKPD